MKRAIAVTVLAAVLAACTQAATVPTSTPIPMSPTPLGELTGEQAASAMGQHRTVCGKVVDSRYAVTSGGSPTFLNYDKPFPNHSFTVLIWGRDRSTFPTSPETFYRGKTLCASGVIEKFNGKPEIIASLPSQLTVK